MIRNVLVLQSSGQVVVEKTYDEMQPFEQKWIGKFLTAITQFGQETFNEQAQEIKFSKLQILLKRNTNHGNYRYRQSWTIVGITDTADDTAEIKRLLNRIAEELHYLQNDDLSTNKSPSQQTIDRIEQVIDRFVLSLPNV